MSQAVMELVLAEPFFGHVLTGVNRRLGEDTPTVGVAFREGRPLLLVHPGYFAKTLTRKRQRVAVLKHEVLHLVLHHALRAVPRGHDPQLWGIAADLVVNQFVGRRWELPEDAVTLDRFAQLGLEPDRTVEHYYERLREAGEAAGLGPGEVWHSDHRHWGDTVDEALGEAELGRLFEIAKQRAGAGYGRLPAPLRELVDALVAKRHPQLDWRRVFRMFASSSRRSRLKSTLRRPSKRYGTYPGHKIRRFARMLVAIDTSGSITDEHLSLFFAEVHGMWRQGAEITVLECDARVHRTYPYAGQLPQVVAGRGGTAFEPVFQWMREARGARWDGVIYLTDGFGPPPVTRPTAPLLWVLTPRGSREGTAFGRVVQLGE